MFALFLINSQNVSTHGLMFRCIDIFLNSTIHRVALLTKPRPPMDRRNPNPKNPSQPYRAVI